APSFIHLLEPSLGVVHPSSAFSFIFSNPASLCRGSAVLLCRGSAFAIPLAVLLAVLVVVLLAFLCRGSARLSLSRFCSLLCRGFARRAARRNKSRKLDAFGYNQSIKSHRLDFSSPISLRAHARALAPLLQLFQRSLASMASENLFKGNLTSLPKPGGGEFGKFYSLPSLKDPRTSCRIVSEFSNLPFVIVTISKSRKRMLRRLLTGKTLPKQVEIPFKPAWVLLEDFTGVPAVVDLDCMRDAMNKLGSDSNKINPLVGPGSLLQAPLDDDASRGTISELSIIVIIIINSNYSFDDYHLLLGMICHVEDLLVNGIMKGSIVHIHRARTVIVGTDGVITASELGCTEGIGKGNFLNGAGGGVGHGGRGGSGYNGRVSIGGDDYGNAIFPCGGGMIDK
ncbi:hypothetical protein S245_066404, partial [Arachis hypogaea]